MTADERYASCMTVRQLNRALETDLLNAATRDEAIECEIAYSKHYTRVFVLTMLNKKESD